MIPKIIHYCWFGKGLMPKSQRDCIKGWKKLMPDYQFMRWDEKSFDTDFCQFTKAAYSHKKYAYVADVARLQALYDFGGIYLDTDVEVFQRFDRFLDTNFFSGIELYREFEAENISQKYLNDDGTAKTEGLDIPHLELLTSLMGSAKGNGFIKEVLEYYRSLSVNDSLMQDFRKFVNFDRLMVRYLTQYGFRYKNETQYLANNMVVYKTGTFGYAFCPDKHYEVSYHHNATTWDSEKWSRSQRRTYFFDKLGLLSVYKSVMSIRKKALSKK